MFSLATDGSSDEKDTFSPILITHQDDQTEFITTSFVDMPVVNSATGANIADAIKSSLKSVDLDLEQVLAFSSDNASVMNGRHKGVLGLIQTDNPNIYGMGCPCNLSPFGS